MEFLFGLPVAAAIGGSVFGMVWGVTKVSFWITETVEQWWLRRLTLARVRPDYWFIAILADLYSWLGIAYMGIGAAQMLTGKSYGAGVFLIAFSVWGIAMRVNDHARKPRLIDTPYLLMWWECGKLEPYTLSLWHSKPKPWGAR